MQRLLILSVFLLAGAVRADEVPPPWAYGFKEPPSPGTTQVAPGRAAPPPTDPALYALPGTDLRFTRAEITNVFGPADFFPREHPVPPAVVTRGKSPSVWSCARCHYYNGKGRPENAGLAGLPVAYFIEQMTAFRRGERRSADPRKPNTPMMVEFARALDDEEIQAAAEYYSALPWTPWIRVVETTRVPRTTISAGLYLPVAGGGDEPLGDRIVEVPEDPETSEIQRSPHVGFVAYVPAGSLKRGEAFVTTGGAGRTLVCAACHGPDLKGATSPGIGAVPGLAGRSPSYLFRQMFDIQTGHRTDTRAALMKPVVANLSSADMLAIAAYLASLRP